MSTLSISRDEFVGGVRLLKKTVRPKRGEEAILSFDGKLFYIDVAGGTVTMPATGEWPDQVRVPAIPLLNLAQHPPRHDPILINQDHGKVQIETTVLGCKLQTPWSAGIQLPVNTTNEDVLALKHQYTQEEITFSGLASAVQIAERRSSSMEIARKALSPWGVTAKDVEELLARVIERRKREV